MNAVAHPAETASGRSTPDRGTGAVVREIGRAPSAETPRPGSAAVLGIANAAAGVAPTPDPGLTLELLRRCREAESEQVLAFIAVNDSHLLAPYRQAALWLRRGGVKALSGVTLIEGNGPYVQWLAPVCQALDQRAADGQPRLIAADDLPPKLLDDWAEWLPAQALWLPIGQGADAGGLLLARDEAWTDAERVALAEWLSNWQQMRLALRQRRSLWAPLAVKLRPGAIALAALIALCAWGGAQPVPLSVLASAELVPANPVAVRAPLDGVVQRVLVRPNESVRSGQPLFAYDDLAMASRRDVAAQALATADTELRQIEQQSLYDAKARASLPAARGNVAEKRAELALVNKQLSRTQVLAPVDGLALFDDPAEWNGRPVSTGERVMRLAAPEDKEIEAWIDMGDAIPLQPGDAVRVYLSAAPTEPLSARVRYLSHEAQKRPDGSHAFRLRATLDQPTAQRVGLKGTARVEGEQVSVAYWIFRRPLAVLREHAGL